MAELDFERRLDRMFTEAPAFADEAAFAARVSERLDRGWRTRSWMIGTAGLAAGVIGVSQLVMGDVVKRVAAAGDSMAILRRGAANLQPRAEWLDAVSAGGGTVWIAAALAVVTLGFAVTRVIEEI